jgi:hypothetical protein
MTDKEAMAMALDALKANYLLVNGTETHGGLEHCLDGYYSSCFDTDPINKQTEEAINALKARLAQEKALQALHNENERLGLYKDAYIEQEPVAHLWECLGRWSAYLVDNGVQADCAPPSWLVDAVKNATTPPAQPAQQEPVGMVKDLFTNAAWDKLDVRGSTKVYLDIPPQRTEQEPAESWEELHNALQRIDTAAVGLPTFEVRHEGGLDAVVQNIVDAIVALHERPTPQRTEQNFCSRCGKRTKDLTHIHTCTPPKD